MRSQPKKVTLEIRHLKCFTNDELFDILYNKSNDYSFATIKQITKILNQRGVYG